MYTKGTTHIDMYEHTFIPWVHFVYFFAHVLSFLFKSKEKKHRKMNERNLETEQIVPELKGEMGYIKRF